VSYKFSILKTSISGTSVYTEMHNVTTNNSGLINFEIGNGTVLAGTFRAIDWESGKWYVKIFTDLQGGEHFTEMGTMEIIIVNGNQAPVSEMASEDTSSNVTDYDGNVYETVEIGTQTWLASNLKSEHYTDGKKIRGVYSYEDLGENAEEYGRLYTWNAAMNNENPTIRVPSTVQGVCPTGYHLPSKGEMEELKSYIAKHYKVGGGLIGLKLKEQGSSHWVNLNGKVGNNETGFSAVGAGHLVFYGDNKDYRELKKGTCFWAATEFSKNPKSAFVLKLYDSGVTVTNSSANKNTSYSIRCIKD
jgi:uncharacterized protein (TIGR02145 family)